LLANLTITHLACYKQMRKIDNIHTKWMTVIP
jgi:hypothetical protein